MTTLKEMLKADYIFHYKAGNKPAVAVLRSVNGAITNEEKAGKSAKDLSDEQVEAVIAREAKKRRASVLEYTSVGETERAAAELWEADFLAQYLPEQLSEDEVRKIVREVVADSGEDTNMGIVMKNAMAQLKGDLAVVKFLIKISNPIIFEASLAKMNIPRHVRIVGK